ncbi:uncharacterized protein LOC121388484 [Gigantopelta aegis]|uniref:uncharacterized protein LOC121388484 n=1 Tax=Gigantopelta aegis TaxID=1735272 RepID=UPI001B88C8E4|nr:uncharacterized protein LOC121388484 [Gigantopelta aegis]
MDTEANDWVEHIKKEMTSLSSLNDEFPVYLVPNQFLTVKGEMVMRVRGGWLSLCDSNKRIIREWELTRIRRYKEENINTFWIECGRTSETGEGKMTFTSTAAHCILERIHEEAVNLIKKSKPPAWTAQERSNLSVQVPIGVNKQPMLRCPTKPDYPLVHQHFVSEPDVSDFAGYYPKQVDRQPKFQRPLLSESTHSSSPQDNSCTDNISTAWSTKGGEIPRQDDQRDSGYLDLTSFQKSFMLPSPPPIADDINLLDSTQSPLRQNELQDMEVFSSQSSAGPGRRRCFTDPKPEGIPEADVQLDLPGDHMCRPPPDNTDSR